MFFTDKIYKKASLPEPYDEAAKFSFLLGRIAAIFLIILFVQTGVIIYQNYTNQGLSKELAKALSKPAMIGLKTPEGYYLSVDEIPVENVELFAKVWVSNWKNLDGYSVDKNLDWSKSKIHPEKRNKYITVFQEKRSIVKDQGVNTIFNILDLSIKKNQEFSYNVKATGKLTKYFSGRPVGKAITQEIEIDLCGVEPTATFTLALAVCDFNDPEFSK